MNFELNAPYHSEEETNPFKMVKLEKEESQSEGHEQGVQNSELALIVSVKVEAKFFILYDSVNEKYIKKERYLLFHIKGRNNPELKACVV